MVIKYRFRYRKEAFYCMVIRFCRNAIVKWTGLYQLKSLMKTFCMKMFQFISEEPFLSNKSGLRNLSTNDSCF